MRERERERERKERKKRKDKSITPPRQFLLSSSDRTSREIFQLRGIVSFDFSDREEATEERERYNEKKKNEKKE